VIYLACPYGGNAPLAVREKRFQAANRAAAELFRRGEYVFSPISHSHPIAQENNLPFGWDFWQGWNRELLKNCDRLIVLMLDGWRESSGVGGEIEYARELGIPVEFMEA
jgi:hypothetical protein